MDAPVDIGAPVAFSPDGRLLAVAEPHPLSGPATALRVYETVTGRLLTRMEAPLVTPSAFDPSACPLIVALRPLAGDKTWTGIVGRLANESIGLVLALEYPAEAQTALTTDVIGVLTGAGRRLERAPNPVQALSEAQHPGSRLAGRRLRPI